MFEHIVRNGILVTVTVLIISVLGILAALRIPVQMIPDLDVRTVSINTRWPGATPQDVEKEILVEQEEYLRNIPNLEEIYSTADFGSAWIELEFPYAVNITETLIQVQNALTQVPSYPVNVDQPQIYASSFSSNAFLFFSVTPLEGNPANLNMDMMRDFLEDNVRPRMSSIEGVSQVDVNGGADRQIQIRIRPDRLAEYNLTLADVRQAIVERNQDLSGGEVESGKRRYLLRTIGRFEDMDELRALILARRGDSLTRLGDVADVRLDHAKIRETTYINTRPALRISVRRESGSNVIAIKRAMMEEVQLINEEVLRPEGMVMELTSGDVVYVQDSIRNVWKNLILGATLAMGVMYLFLKSFRATAIGVVGIPICTIAAFLGLLIAGRTINVISLAGVAFAIGMTLDNSIVVLESIELERRKGLSRFRAAMVGVQKVWPAVLASTLTTIMVFLPVLFIREEAGQLYSDVGIAISASILVSMVVAITVIPTLSARLGFSDSGMEVEGQRANLFSGAVYWLIETPRRRIGCILVTVAASVGIFAFLTPPAEYLPEGEEAKTFATLSAPSGYNLATMEQVGAELLDYFMPFVGDDPAAFERGETEVPSMKSINLSIEPQGLQIMSQSTDPGQIDELMDAIVSQYETYPGMRAFASRGSIISSNDGGTRSINLDISGSDLADVFRVAEAAYRRAGEIFDNPSIQTSPSNLSLTQPMLQVRPHWDRIAELGMSTEDVGFTVAALTDGAFVNEFFLGDDKVDMYLYSRQGPGGSVDSLKDIAVFVPGNTTLPLSELADVQETVDTSSIRRVAGRRTVTLNIIPPRSVALETGVQRVREELVTYLRDSGQIPLGVSLNISGAADQLDSTRESLAGNYLVSLIIIYLLMVAIFAHWGYPLLIMTTIPLGIAGGIAGLALMNLLGSISASLGFDGFRQPFDMISMLGFLILMGTVVNNPILIVHRAVSNLKEQAMQPVVAVREAVSSRLRPIAISSITTIVGLAPLVFLPGAGSELYRGVGVIVMSGIVGATLVTLTMLPALTVMVLEWRGNKGFQVSHDVSY